MVWEEEGSSGEGLGAGGGHNNWTLDYYVSRGGWLTSPLCQQEGRQSREETKTERLWSFDQSKNRAFA